MERKACLAADRDAILQSFKGVGLITSLPDRQAGSKLLASLPELGTFSSRKISALVGVAPLNRDSGKFRGTRGTWGSRRPARSRRGCTLQPLYGRFECLAF